MELARVLASTGALLRHGGPMGLLLGATSAGQAALQQQCCTAAGVLLQQQQPHQQRRSQPWGRFISTSASSGAQPMPVAAAVSPGSSAFGVAMPPPPLVSATPAAAAASRVAVGRVIAAPLRIKALLVDAAGTLLVPSEPVADVYLRYAAKHGAAAGLTRASVLANFRAAYNAPWAGSRLRYVADARPFWRAVVAASVGSACEALFEDVYAYYADAAAWRLAPGAAAALTRLRAAGVKLAVCSNFDTRLRPLLDSLGVGGLFDAVVVSAEVGAEKPSPVIFEAAVRALGVGPAECVHVGDDRRNDVWGGRDAGVTAWLWGSDVHSFEEVARRVLHMQRSGLMAWDDEDD